jgi:hypothetical protein
MARLCAFAEQTSLPPLTHRGWKPLPPKSGRRQGWSAAQSASEPLPSWDDSSDPQAFHHNPAQRPGPPLHYQWRDYAPLQSRPPCLRSPIAAGSRPNPNPAGTEDRDGLRRKAHRSLYLPGMTAATRKLSTTTAPKGLAPLSTINGATMRLCRADLPASAHSSRPYPRSQQPVRA